MRFYILIQRKIVTKNNGAGEQSLQGITFSAIKLWRTGVAGGVLYCPLEKGKER